MKVMGIDPGQRRIGLAVSDDDGRMALPVRTVVRTSRDQALGEIAAEAGARQVERLVVGLPLRLDGTEGPEARRARELARELSQRTGLPVTLWDERLTTVSADRALREAGVRGPGRRDVVDQAAAVVLLQGFLDARAGSSPAGKTDEGG